MAKERQFNVAPLNSSFMITTIVAFIVSSIYVYPRSNTWGFTFSVFFGLMFVAAMISMTYGPEEAMLHTGHLRARKKKKSLQ